MLAALAVFTVGRVLIAYATRPSRWSPRFALPEEPVLEKFRAPLLVAHDEMPLSPEAFPNADDLSMIAKRRGAMSAAIRNRDVVSYVSYFSSDAVSLTMAGIAIVGSAALAEALYRTLRTAHVVGASIATSDRRVCGGSIFEEGTFHIQLRTGEADVLSKGRFATLWKRELGEWRIVFEAVRAIG